MKYILLILSVLVFGCYQGTEKAEPPKQTGLTDYTIVTIDSCEYVVYSEFHAFYRTHSSGITHKGNCKFCKARK